MIKFGRDRFDSIRTALAFSGRISGKTHDFYHYPARFPPQLARTVIQTFSRPNEWVLDPFMGGGTSIIEGLALGRQMAGVDINALAHFVASVRTTALSETEEEEVIQWAYCVSQQTDVEESSVGESVEVRNLPRNIESFLAKAKRRAGGLQTLKARLFATCALLRLGQWALDCRDIVTPSQQVLSRKLPTLVTSMIHGLRELTMECITSGVQKRAIRSRRILLNCDAAGIDQEPALRSLLGQVRLVLTSPPYPGVHVLYHRWQYRGRKETPAPYWIAGLPDGNGAAFYTLGGRTPHGIENYFRSLEAVFRSLMPLLHKTAMVAQVVAFSDSRSQLPRYLSTMQAAGYTQLKDDGSHSAQLKRRVPNRKWYARSKLHDGAATEFLLLHTPGVSSIA